VIYVLPPSKIAAFKVAVLERIGAMRGALKLWPADLKEL